MARRLRSIVSLVPFPAPVPSSITDISRLVAAPASPNLTLDTDLVYGILAPKQKVGNVLSSIDGPFVTHTAEFSDSLGLRDYYLYFLGKVAMMVANLAQFVETLNDTSI